MIDNFEIEGMLKVNILEACLSEIVRRHEGLRTTFKTIDGEPVQIINPYQPIKLKIIDLQQLSAGEQETKIVYHTYQEVEQPFDLQHGPLYHFVLLILGEHHHILSLIIHHIVSDGWSSAILMNELKALYLAFSQEQPSPLADLTVQYADFAVWQQQYLQGQTLQKHLRYWREQLGDDNLPLPLPLDHPRPKIRTENGATEACFINQEITAKLRALGNEANASLFMVVLAACKRSYIVIQTAIILMLVRLLLTVITVNLNH